MVEKFKRYLKRYSVKEYLRKNFSNGSKVIPIVVLALTILTLVICINRKTMIVSIDGKETKVITLSSTYREALANNGIVVGPKDKSTINLDDKVQNGARLSIKRAVNVKVDVDGKELNIQSAEDNVGKMLYAEGIRLQDFDKVYPSKDTAITQGLKVDIIRVQEKEIKEIKPIDYATVVKNDDSIQKGNNEIIQEGQPGEKESIVKVIYENGKEISRKVVGEIIKRQPIQKIVAMGTLNMYTPSRGGKILYRNSMRMRATAYTADYASTGKGPGDSGFGITALGTVAKRNMDSYSSVAVDPRVIPLGTKLYIEGYGYAIAEDTGGAIKGNSIDLFFNSSLDANNWGIRWIDVYMIK